MSVQAQAVPVIDGYRLGRIFRAVRIRLRLRQVDVARRAGVSATVVGRIEAGRLDEVSLHALESVARVLDIRLDLVARWRGGELDRMLNVKHAALGEATTEWITASDGWRLRPEVSFAIRGERGVIDLLAWHAPTRTLLVIELKTDIVDVGEMLGTFDRKRRLAGQIARELGWDPLTVASALIVMESRTNRRRVARFASTLRAALPDDGRRLRAWLAAPAGTVNALTFLPIPHKAGLRQDPANVRRVRPAAAARSAPRERAV